MTKNVGIEVHLKDSEVSQKSSNYTVLKMSEKVAAGRSGKITLSSTVKWSGCLVSFTGAARWNTASSNLKVTQRQRVFRRKPWPCPFASICNGTDNKRWRDFACKSVHHYLLQLSAEGEVGLRGSCAGSLHRREVWYHTLRLNSGICWQVK